MVRKRSKFIKLKVSFQAIFNGLLLSSLSLFKVICSFPVDECDPGPEADATGSGGSGDDSSGNQGGGASAKSNEKKK